MIPTPSGQSLSGIAAATRDLGSVLLDITTDYAAPMMERFGFPSAALRVLQEGFRPEVEFMGNDVRGVVARELDMFMGETFAAMARGGADVHQVAQFLCSLCAGRDHWADLGTEDWTRTLKAWMAPSTEGMTRLGRLFDHQVAQPLTVIDTYERSVEEPWMKGQRTAWDDVAFASAYQELGIPPSLRLCFERRFVRLFAAEAVATLPDEVLAAGHDAAQSALAAAGEYDAAGDVLPLPIIAERWEADWKSVVRALEAAGFQAGADTR